MDISMCTNKDCPKKEDCLRFKGTPNTQGQSYINFRQICNTQAENNFKWFIQIEKSMQETNNN